MPTAAMSGVLVLREWAWHIWPRFLRSGRLQNDYD